jgi:alkaline phosphatase D
MLALLFLAMCVAGCGPRGPETSTDRSDPPALPTGAIQRIAFGSCAKHWQHQPILDTVRATRPDLWLFLGDAIYADTDSVTAWDVTEKALQGEWNRLADKPEWQRFRAAVAMMAVWDNHDYGTHNGGAEFEGREFSKRIFLDFFGEPKDSPRRKHPGIYDARVFGPAGRRVQIILLDTRYNRSPFHLDKRSKEERARSGKVGKYSPHPDPSTTILGKEQWAWLEGELNKPAEVRLICSSTQIIPDQKGMDEWGCFPHERKRLLGLAARTNGVVLLTGNVHFAEVSKLNVGGRELVEFTSSGMTHVNEAYAKAVNRYRVAGPFAEVNFGLVEIDWQAKPSPVITLKAVAVNGTVVFRSSLALRATTQ